MQTSEIVLLGIAAIIGVLIFMRVMRSLFRIIFILAVIAALYYFISGKTVTDGVDSGIESMFRNTTITELMNQKCPPSQLETLACKCAIVPAYQDFTTRFSPAEIQAMMPNRTKMLEETWKSFAATRGAMGTCFNEKKEKGIQVFQKIKDLYNLLSK